MAYRRPNHLATGRETETIFMDRAQNPTAWPCYLLYQALFTLRHAAMCRLALFFLCYCSTHISIKAKMVYESSSFDQSHYNIVHTALCCLLRLLCWYIGRRINALCRWKLSHDVFSPLFHSFACLIVGKSYCLRAVFTILSKLIETF